MLEQHQDDAALAPAPYP
jgi:hypothetical protein